MTGTDAGLRAVLLSTMLAMSALAAVHVGAVGVAAAGNAPTCSSVGYEGSGTSGDPYRVTNVSQLQCVEDDLGATYEQHGDIDASGTADWNDGRGFDPLGDDGRTFTGTYDGRGYRITGLTIDRGGTNYVSLFGNVDLNANIRNVGLDGGSVTGNDNTGGLAGYNRGIITQSYATGPVTGNDYVGGLVGQSSIAIRQSYATGDVQGDNNVGGLLGYSRFADVEQSYAAGAVSGDGDVGGLVGLHLGRVDRSYATGAVTVSGSGGTGGLVADSYDATVVDSYWDNETTGRDTSNGGTALTTSQMRGASATTNMTGLDVGGTWEVVEGGDTDAARDWYPILSGLDREIQLAAQDVHSPEVSSITRDASVNRVTNADSVAFDVTFSGPVSGVSADDFTLSTTGTATTASGDSDISVSSDGRSYLVTVANVAGDGDIRLDLEDDGSITDSDGDPLGGPGTVGVRDGSYAGDENVTIDNTDPAISAVTLVDGDGVVTGGDSPVITATVTDASTIETVEADASAFGAGTVTLTDQGPRSSPRDDRYSAILRVDADPTEGAQSVTVNATDEAGNGGDQAVSSGPLTVDTTVPSISAVTLADDTDGNGAVATGDTVQVTATVTDATAIETVDADASAFDADATGFGPGTVTLADDGPNSATDDDQYSATLTVGTEVTDGERSVTVSAFDDAGLGGGQAVASGTLTVDNEAPTADAGSNLTVDEDRLASFDATNSTDNDAVASYEWDFDGNGTTDATGATATYTYDDPGNYTVTLTVTDVAGHTDTDTLNVMVEDTGGGGSVGVVDTSLASDDAYTVTAGAPLDVPAGEGVLANDDAGGPWSDPSVSVVSGPARGSLDLSSDGAFTYTPDGAGTDSFTYELRDGFETERATVTLTVDAAPAPEPTVFSNESAIRQSVDVPADATPTYAERVSVPANSSGATVTFSGNATVDSVRFETGLRAGGNLTVVEFASSDSVPDGVPGQAFETLQIDGSPSVANAPATVRMRLDRDDLPAETTASAVRVAHYDDGAWRVLNTTVVGESDDSVTVEVVTSGFSPFALTAVGSAEPTVSRTTPPAVETAPPATEPPSTAGDGTQPAVTSSTDEPTATRATTGADGSGFGPVVALGAILALAGVTLRRR